MIVINQSYQYKSVNCAICIPVTHLIYDHDCEPIVEYRRKDVGLNAMSQARARQSWPTGSPTGKSLESD